MYRTFEIRQEPGPRARAGRQFAPLPRLVTRVEASTGWEALEEHIFQTYISSLGPTKRSYGGHRIEWRSTRNLTGDWRPNDGGALARDGSGERDPGARGREWSAVLTLRNGTRAKHEVRLLAWPVSS